MNVLEKILEEIEERIKRLKEADNMCRVNAERNRNFESMKYFQSLMFATERAESIIGDIIRSHMDEKEKVTSAEIVSREVDGKTYYEIKYKEVGKDYYTVGYGSYKLDYVVCWLNEYFEFCGEAKVVVGVGKDTNIPSNVGWIPVEERLPDRLNKESYDINLVTLENGEVCIGVYRDDKKEWWTRKKEGETLYTTKHNVIAWQRLPEPYKPKKLQTEEKPVQ